MKHLSKRLVALALSFAMVATMTPATTQAASKKTMTVSTQAELTKALKTKGVSKIVVKTQKAVKFTVKKGKYLAKLEMNAPKATLTNSGTWSGITVTDAKGYTEKAKSNKIVIKDKKLDLTVAKGASAKSVTFAKKGASHNVKINGTVSAVTISSPTTVKITANGTLKKVTVDAKTSLSLGGSSEKKVAMTMTKNAKSSSVKSAVPVSVKASANVAITLKAGAEGSSVAVKSADAKIDLTNGTKDTIEVTKADGTKVSVATGEKADTSKSDSEKEDEKKDEEKKPETGGGAVSGGGSSEVEDKTPSLTLDKSSVTLSKWDNEGKLTLNATKKNIADEIEWLSSDEGKASVNQNGMVTYVATGSAVITASAGGIQATCVVTTTDEVISASGFAAAVAGTAAGGTVTLGSDIAGNVIATVNSAVTIDMKNYKLNGSLTLKEKKGLSSGYSVILQDNGEEKVGATITGDFTVNLPNGHVENNVCVEGNSNIEAVSNTTYQVKDKEKKVLLKGSGKLDIKADKRIAPQVVVDTDKQITLAGNVTEVSVEKPAEITVDADATVEKIEVKNSAATKENTVTVKGAGKVTALEAKAPVEVAVETTELSASAPVVVSSGATVANVYVESDQASISLDAEAKIDSLSVNSTSVSTLKIEGSGTVGLVDVTRAQSTVSVQLSEQAAQKITSVVATDTQKDSITKSYTQLQDKVKVPQSIKVEKTAVKLNYYVGEAPVITGASIKIVYSDNSESSLILVTDKMLDLSAVKKDIPGKYTIKLSYAGIVKADFAVLTYIQDTVSEKAYIAGSLKKKEYTRGDRLDPSGVVVKLTYASGKTEQVLAGDERLSFWNDEIDLTKTPLPTKSDDYAVEIKFEGVLAGTQKIIVKPKKYTVKLNANENVGAPGRVEVLTDVEEFTTLNQLKDTGKLSMVATPTPSAITSTNRFWEFVKWTEVGDKQENAYSWDTPIEGNIELIGRWDTVKSIEYVPNSLEKRVYTRGEAFYASGAAIRLTLNSGKTKDITSEGQVKFTDNDEKELSTVSPARKGDYVINVMFDGKIVGSQTVKVEPIYYTVTLNLNESGTDGEKETVKVEEFTTLKQWKEDGKLQMSESPSATAAGHEMWDFLKWVKAEDATKTAYSWNTPVESDLNLIGCWDTIKEAQYVADSMNKRTYTRMDKFDPTGAKIRLTYESGKTKEITDTSKMLFTDQNGMKLENTSWQKKGEHEIKICYGTYPAGSQIVTVNPIYYTVTLNPNEGGRETVTVKDVEEFTTLNQLCSAGAIKLTEVLKPMADDHRAWKFLGWGSDGDANTKDYYGWDARIESNLNLVAEWSENGLDQDEIKLEVLGKPVKEDRTYRVQVTHVDHFLHAVSASSIYAGEDKVFVKYAIAGTDNWSDYNLQSTVDLNAFEANKTYEFVYYTKDGDTYNGATNSIFVETKVSYIEFDTEAKGIIWLNDAKVEVGCKPLDYPMSGIPSLSVSYGSITVTPKNPDGNAYKAWGNYYPDRGVVEFGLYVQAEDSTVAGSGHKEEKPLPLGEYQIDFTYLENPQYNMGVPVEPEYPVSVNVKFDCAFEGKTSVSSGDMWDSTGNYVPLNLIKYEAGKSTVADYIEGVIPGDVELAYAQGIALGTGSAIYKPITDLGQIRVNGESCYSLKVTNKNRSRYYYMEFYEGVKIIRANEMNRNCVSLFLAAPLADDTRFRVIRTSPTGMSPQELGVKHIIGNGGEVYLILNQHMDQNEQYRVEAYEGGKKTECFFNSLSYNNYNDRYYVTGMGLDGDNKVSIKIEPKQNMAPGWHDIRVILTDITNNGWKDIDCKLDVDLTNNRLILTTKESLREKKILVTVYGSSFDAVYESEIWPQFKEVTGVENLILNQVQKVSDSALKCNISDKNDPQNTAGNGYGIIVRQLTNTFRFVRDVAVNMTDHQGDIVVNGLPLEEMSKDKEHIYCILVYSEKKPLVKEFSNFYYLNFSDGEISFSDKSENEKPWQNISGVKSLSIESANLLAENAINFTIVDSMYDPNTKNEYYVNVFRQGCGEEAISGSYCPAPGQVVVGRLPLNDMSYDSAYDSPYYVTVSRIHETEQKIVCEDSDLYRVNVKDGKVDLIREHDNEDWLGVEVGKISGATVQFNVLDNESDSNRKYYLEIRKDIYDGDEWLYSESIKEVYWTSDRSLSVTDLPLDNMEEGSGYYLYVGCTDATGKWIAYSVSYDIYYKNGELYLIPISDDPDGSQPGEDSSDDNQPGQEGDGNPAGTAIELFDASNGIITNNTGIIKVNYKISDDVKLYFAEVKLISAPTGVVVDNNVSAFYMKRADGTLDIAISRNDVKKLPVGDYVLDVSCKLVDSTNSEMYEEICQIKCTFDHTVYSPDSESWFLESDYVNSAYALSMRYSNDKPNVACYVNSSFAEQSALLYKDLSSSSAEFKPIGSLKEIPVEAKKMYLIQVTKEGVTNYFMFGTYNQIVKCRSVASDCIEMRLSEDLLERKVEITDLTDNTSLQVDSINFNEYTHAYNILLKGNMQYNHLYNVRLFDGEQKIDEAVFTAIQGLEQ